MILQASTLICLVLMEVGSEFNPKILPKIGGIFDNRFRPDSEVIRRAKRANYTRIGDMIYPPWGKRSSWTAAGTWPRNTVPYIVSNNVTSELRGTVYDAIRYYHNYTCVRFVWANPDRDNYWIRFMMDPALVQNPDSPLKCSAGIGFQNREDQEVNLGRKCTFGAMVHELLHTLGFNHEHSRPDRDYYLNVFPENMIPLAYEQYEREDVTCRELGFPCEFETYGIPFNYDSIMNYCKTCGSSNTKPVMESRRNQSGIGAIDGRKLGQLFGFSQGDWLAVNRKHGCDPAYYPNIKRPPPIPENPPMSNDYSKPSCRKRYPKV